MSLNTDIISIRQKLLWDYGALEPDTIEILRIENWVNCYFVKFKVYGGRKLARFVSKKYIPLADDITETQTAKKTYKPAPKKIKNPTENQLENLQNEIPEIFPRLKPLEKETGPIFLRGGKKREKKPIFSLKKFEREVTKFYSHAKKQGYKKESIILTVFHKLNQINGCYGSIGEKSFHDMLTAKDMMEILWLFAFLPEEKLKKINSASALLVYLTKVQEKIVYNSQQVSIETVIENL